MREVVKGYEPRDIWNMDETGVFFRVLPERGLVDKKTKAKLGKRSKLRMTEAFLLVAMEAKSATL